MFLKDVCNILRGSIRLQCQSKTFINSWLLYNIPAYKNIIFCGLHLQSGVRVAQLFNTVASAALPKDKAVLAKAHVVAPIAITQYDYTYLLEDTLSPLESVFDMKDIYDTLAELTIYAHLLGVYHLLTTLFFYRIHA